MKCPCCNIGTVVPTEEKIVLNKWGTLIGRCNNMNCGQLIANWDKLSDETIKQVVSDYEKDDKEFIVEDKNAQKLAIKVVDNKLYLRKPSK